MINGALLRDAIISGANNITNQRETIDALNIFPVPDGDTGTNMSMTINSAASVLKTMGDDCTASEVAKKTVSALLRGARGNSGVITSLIFRGFSKAIGDKETVSGKALALAIEIGVKEAYAAVMKPAEGTILTVGRVAGEKAVELSKINDDVLDIWEEVCLSARAALETTPDLLPVLKKAGVVDAGGQGLCVIFEGMLSVIKDGKIIECENVQGNSNAPQDSFSSAIAEYDEDINFTYCTEFIVGKDEECKTDENELRAYLETIGDCVVVVSDEEIIKVHVHTEDPGNALQEGLKFGQLLTVKVENMKQQNKNASSSKKKLSPVEPTEEIGFVAVAAGQGLEDLFIELGCNNVVSGGQSMNPSTKDIVAAVMATGAKNVFVLPNNKNIIMAAMQAVPLVEDRNVIVIPTKTIPQGISAMLNFDGDLPLRSSKKLMTDAIENVSTGQVTFAARNSEFGSTKIKKGEIIALNNGKLCITEKEDFVKATYRLVKLMVKKDSSFITLFYGEGVSEEKAQNCFNIVNSKFGSNVDVTLVKGDQPVYYFIVSVE